MNIGYQIPVRENFYESLKQIKNIKIFQILLRTSNPILDKNIINIKNYLKENNINLIVHCIFNLAKDYSKKKFEIEIFEKGLIQASHLESLGIILHIGKLININKKKGFENIKINVRNILKIIPKNTKLILENTVGDKGDLGTNIEEINEIYNLFSKSEKKRIGFCLDTCHLFVCGINISDKNIVKNLLIEFDKLIGINKLSLIHFNDSRNKLNSKLDGHEDIGFGLIKKEGLEEFVKFAKKNSIPLILETTQKHISYQKQIKNIRNYLN